MITLALLKEALRIPAGDTTEDAYLTQCEAAAVRYVETYTGRYFGATGTRTEYLSGVGQRELWLLDTPAPNSVTVQMDGQAVPAADFTVRDRRLRHTTAWGSARFPVDIVVTYTAGYAAGQEPADIRQVVTWLAVHCFTERAPVVTGTITAEMPMHLRSFLDQHRRVRV